MYTDSLILCTYGDAVLFILRLVYFKGALRLFWHISLFNLRRDLRDLLPLPI